MALKIADFFYVYFCYSKNILRSWFQYKVDAFMRSIAVFLREATNVIVIYFTLQTFGGINGWDSNEIFFLYSLLFLTYGILIIFFTGLRDFGQVVNKGEFDRFMLRPRGLLFQVVACNSDWFAAIGHGGLGIFLFILSAGKVGIIWSFGTVLYYWMAITGGVLIQGAIFLFLASLSFFFIKTGNIKALTYGNARKFAGYPISIYPKVIQVFMIYIVPFAFVNYFPAQFLLRNKDLELFPEILIYLTPLVGMIMYVVAYVFWRFCLHKYKSTGN